MNLSNIRARSHIIKLIRAWFDEQGFTEMHTARLVGLPGQEPHLDPFWTEVFSPSLQPTAYSLPASLITSPEYAMKRLLAEGMDKIYDLGPCFRNGEPFDGTHDPEFLLLEWYRRDAGLEDLMRDTEEMMKWVAMSFRAQRSGVEESLSDSERDPSALVGMTEEKPFHRLTVRDAWKEHLNIDLDPLLDHREAMVEVARAHGQTVDAADTWDDLYFKVFLTHIEPKLGEDQPTFLYQYPASMAALARRSAHDPRYADRVELYVGKLELANGFAELADPLEQHARFEEEQNLRKKIGKPTWPIDEKFIECLPRMGNAAGIAFGVDRFVMLLTGATSINDVIPFSARERFTSQT